MFKGDFNIYWSPKNMNKGQNPSEELRCSPDDHIKFFSGYLNVETNPCLMFGVFRAHLVSEEPPVLQVRSVYLDVADLRDPRDLLERKVLL